MSKQASSTRLVRRLTSLFPFEFLEEHAENSAWSNVIGSSRFPPSSGHSCSASPQAKAEHSPIFDAVTTQRPTKRSLQAVSISG